MKSHFVILSLIFISYIAIASQKPNAPITARIDFKKPNETSDMRSNAKKPHLNKYDTPIWTNDPIESIKNFCCNLHELLLPLKEVWMDVCCRCCYKEHHKKKEIDYKIFDTEGKKVKHVMFGSITKESFITQPQNSKYDT